MKFSVLISVYQKDNVDFFRCALESITVKQSIRPTQVVIVQDGPVSEMVDEIIVETKILVPDIEFTIVKKEKNAGLAAALNSGLSACKYSWVARMDSDDIAAVTRFEHQIDYINKHSDVSAVGGAIAEFENEIGDISSERHVKLEHKDIKMMARTRTPMNHVSVMFLKEAVEEIGGYSENFGKLEDYKLWVDLISAGKILGNLDEILVYVRVGNGFIERRSHKREIQDWDMLQGYLLKSNLITKRKALMNRLYIRTFIYMPGWLKRIAYRLALRG